MKSLALALLIAAATPALAQTPAASPFRPDGTTDGIRMTRVGEGIYQFTASNDGYVENTNATAIVGRDGVLLFDTYTRPATARAMLAMLRTVTDKPVRWVVNSHWHPDHWSGNEVFAEAFPGVEIIATEGTARYMRNIGHAWPTTLGGALRRMREAPPGATDAARAEQAVNIAQLADLWRRWAGCAEPSRTAPIGTR